MQDFLLALRQFTIFAIKGLFAFIFAVLVLGFTFVGGILMKALKMRP
jgi:hypothetical protein